MAEIPEPIDPNEATEAKLCAYLDGELSPIERAEIEEYLKNYPQHRQTLTDLAAHREIIRQLPRETAPAEVAEAFKGHMERSMLLDEGSDVDPTIRLNRWPQMALAAAIVVLAVGLGVVVYIILPGPQHKYSVAPAVPASQPAPVVVVTLPPVIAETPAAVPAEVEAPKPALADATPPAQTTAAKAAANQNETALSFRSAAPTANLDTLKTPELSLDKSVTDRLSRAGLTFNASSLLCVVVQTNDPAAADRQVKTYFASNNIPYQTIEENTLANGKASLAANQPATLKILPPQSPTTEPLVAGSAIAQNENPTTQPNVSLASNDATLKDTPTTQPTLQAQIQDRDRQIQQLQENVTDAGETLNPNIPPLFIARSITREEAAHLGAVLSTDQLGQTANVYPVNDQKTATFALSAPAATQPTTAPTTQPTIADHPIEVGDRLTITVAQLVGPGVDKTNTVRVTDSGTISLPMIESVPAAGEPKSELEKQIAQKYKEANLIPDATVTVNPAATTQATEVIATSATKPADVDKVDVVVVVRKNPQTIEPTTQPSAP